MPLCRQGRSHHCSVKTHASAGPEGGGPSTAHYKRRTKKNKYARFSKADKLSKDPLEAMISESNRKIREIEVEKAKRQNKKLPLTEEERKALSNEKRERNKLEFPDTSTIDPYDPCTYGYTELGTVVGAHGVYGLVKIVSVTDFPERLTKRGVRHLKPANRRSPREILLLEGRHRVENEYLVKFEGCGDRDAALKLRGHVLYARQTERPDDIGDDEYLISDLVGLDVFLEEGYGDFEASEEMDETEADEEKMDIKSTLSERLGGRFVGTVGGIVLAEEMCSVPGLGQDLLEIVLPRGRNGTPSFRDELVLIPLVPDIVPRVDVQEGKIHITPPAGLLDLTYVKEERLRIKGFLAPAKDKD